MDLILFVLALAAIERRGSRYVEAQPEPPTQARRLRPDRIVIPKPGSGTVMTKGGGGDGRR